MSDWRTAQHGAETSGDRSGLVHVQVNFLQRLSFLTYLLHLLCRAYRMTLYDAPRLAFPALNKVQARTPRKLARFVDGVSPLAPPRVIKLLQLRWVKVV